jgi:predicted Fe-Mo cluster-binding NifX family protein
MKIYFPTTHNQGMNSQLFEHFGSAPMFLLVDAETGEVEEHDNINRGHAHGNCQPLRAIEGLNVDAIVVGAIGRGALNGLHLAGLKVYQACPGTLADNLAQISAGTLQELTNDDVCGGHGQSHGHGHGHCQGHGSRHEFGCGF